MIYHSSPRCIVNVPQILFDSTSAPLPTLVVERVRLSQPDGFYCTRVTDTEEAVVHFLSGSGIATIRGPWGRRTIDNLGGRRNIFSELSHSLVIRSGSVVWVAPKTRYLDLFVARAKVKDVGADLPTVLHPSDWQIHEIGEGNLKRTVREIVGGLGITKRLRLGETINCVGGISSYPHHEFESQIEKSDQFEEVFMYFTDPKYSWGLQRRMGAFSDFTNVDDVLIVKSGDVALIPLGRHPVFSAPDSRIAYVWVYASDENLRKEYPKFTEDLGGYA